MSNPLVTRRLKIAGVCLGGTIVLLSLTAILLLSFGWGLLRPVAERRLSASLGSRVTIGRIHRLGGGLLDPLLGIQDVRIAQPAWAGPGEMLRLREARVRLPVLGLLVGHPHPGVTLIDGMRLAMARDASGRANWEKRGPKHASGGPAPDLTRLRVRDAVIKLDDARHQHHFLMNLSIDGRGLRLAGPGNVAGSPATIAIEAPPLGGAGPWAFRAAIRSPLVTLLADGRMRAPLDLAHFTAAIHTSGHDLIDLDHLIEAGLFHTQPFRLAATIRHDRAAWFIDGLTGTIGRSNLAGDIAVRKHDDRTVIDGAITSAGFDFDDLASDEGLAMGAAEERRLGPRLVPATRIDLSKLRRTDGTLKLHIATILSRKPTVFRALDGAVTLDHGVLTAAPLTARMAAGVLKGSVVIRHQTGLPLLLVDLRLTDSRLERLFRTGGILSGPLDARVLLQGHGDTVRDAVSRADGKIALVSRNGAMGHRAALFLGSDIGHGLFAGNSQQVGIRCLIADFALRGGIARPAPLLLDTPVARADGSGGIALSDERIALALDGKPKQTSILRLNGPIDVGGTIGHPTINPPPQTKSAGGLLRMIGKAIGGDRASLAADADCAGLAATALR